MTDDKWTDDELKAELAAEQAEKRPGFFVRRVAVPVWALILGAILAAAIGNGSSSAEEAAPATTTTTRFTLVEDNLPRASTTTPTTVAQIVPLVSLPPTTVAPATTAAPTTRATAPPTTSAPVTVAQSTSYANCTAARAAGAAPVYRGDPGYGSHLDRDDDGVGCEN